MCLKVLSQWNEAGSDDEIQHATMEGRLDAWCPDSWVAFQRESRNDNGGSGDPVSIAQVAQPMMLPDDLAVLDAALNICRVVVEYGGGGSTLHLGSRLKGWGRLVTIEHQRNWYFKVQGLLVQHSFTVDNVLQEPRPLRRGDGATRRYLPGQMDEYVRAPHALVKDGEADLLFVDGRERIRCALDSAKLLRPGGLLMIHDFWSRARYRASLAELLVCYDYLFETPERRGDDPQGMAVFAKKMS